ncbi:ketol-acid reductoisomerase [Candidatus Woesearchaeota archaeon]|nr:ketol-acid reductoisomerase [Candidatus Woesearchaeota archaeon]
MKVFHDEDVNDEILSGKTVATIGYGAQGAAQANMLKDSGVNVIIGETEVIGDKKNPSWQKAKDDGFEVMTISEAAEKADIIQILLPDEIQSKVYESQIKQSMKAGKALYFSHGFNICFKRIVAPEDVDVIMVAPKAPGTEERKAYLEGFGVPALVAVHKDASGKAKDTAMALAKAMHFTKAGVIECTFEQETYEDLFGEQAVLCGGLVELMKSGFEVLVEAGYPPEMAYFECVHEMKLIVDLVWQGGIKKMAEVISNTAEYGMWSVGKKIIGPEVKEKMKEALKRVESGDFANEWIEEYKKGIPLLKKSREEIGNHQIEKTGEEIRRLFKKE